MLLYAGLFIIQHAKTFCYSCVFYSQKRVALTAVTILYKMTWYILKSVDFYHFCSYCIWDFIDILSAYDCKQNNTVALQSSNIFEPLQAESKTILNILITAYELDSAGIKIQEKRAVKNRGKKK